MLDFSCFIGPWPTHPLAVETFDELRQLHEKNGISGGFVSNLKSVFYRDFFYSEEELYQQIKGTSYRQIMTVNPKYPACMDIVRHGIENWNIAGVRITPTYHGYDLTAPELEELCQILKDAGLPLYLTMNLEDVRNSYLLIPESLRVSQICQWLDEHHDVTVLICGGGTYDMGGLSKAILNHPAAFFDPSGCRHTSAPLTLLRPEMLTRLVYGSMAGVLCLKSSVLHMEMGDVPPEQVKRSMEGTDFLAKCPGIHF